MGYEQEFDEWRGDEPSLCDEGRELLAANPDYFKQLFSTNRKVNMDYNKMSFDQLVPANSKYLSKSDVGEDGVIATVKGFSETAVKDENGNTEDKMVVHFVEDLKPMILNRTNAQLLGAATNSRTVGEAVGKQVVVYVDPNVNFGGKLIGGLRIKKIPGAPQVARAATPAKSADFDDKVPF